MDHDDSNEQRETKFEWIYRKEEIKNGESKS